jgi:hypothetical protein
VTVQFDLTKFLFEVVIPKEGAKKNKLIIILFKFTKEKSVASKQTLRKYSFILLSVK